jgi:hypothetical protein
VAVECGSRMWPIGVAMKSVAVGVAVGVAVELIAVNDNRRCGSKRPIRCSLMKRSR